MKPNSQGSTATNLITVIIISIVVAVSACVVGFVIARNMRSKP